MTEALRKLIQFPSVANVENTPEAPYGKACGQVLEYALHLCQSLGMDTVNRDGKVGWAEIGEGAELTAVLVHLDVVPAGEGWTYPAYDLTEVDDRLYGRGVIDDKGPAIACIYAMRDLLDSGTPLKRRVRLIFGQNEETGVWTDLQYYREREELPVFGFTPDARFPAICGEKGLLAMDISMPMERSKLADLQGGDAGNMVPAWCRAVLKNGELLETTGRAVHASVPETGENAITNMMALLAERVPDDPMVSFYQAHIGTALNGEKMGCALWDEPSGKLTMNAGVLRVKDGRLVLTLDVRNPVTFHAADVLNPMRQAAAQYGLDVELTRDIPPIYMEKNSPVLQTLLDVYRQTSGQLDAEPLVIGGGTYARAMANIVAFGRIPPEREATQHQKNEFILREDFYRMREIYRAAIERLANL